MEEQRYITGGQAWWSSEKPALAAPAPRVSDELAPRVCRGCGEPLPDNRKAFHNKRCQGFWLGTQEAAHKAAAKEENA